MLYSKTFLKIACNTKDFVYFCTENYLFTENYP